jgi:hypothetical protein
MSDILAAFGVGDDDLVSQIETVSYPTPVQGRVAHIDADFIAYQVSAESNDEVQGLKPRKSLEDMQNNAKRAAEHLMRCAGATSYHCHITPGGSDKGGRSDQAVQQEYQSARKGRDKPEFLDVTRAYIGQELNGVVHLTQEADDGMARANYDAEDRNLSVIVSMDKDLRMVPGLHYDFDTDTVIDVDKRFGHIWIDDTKSTKTLKGWGTKFFWAQCLMGDAADTIKGLPAVSGRTVQGFTPTKAYQTVFQKWVDEEDPAKRAALDAKLDAFYAKPKLIGPALTFELLEDIKSDKDAFHFVRRQWQQVAEDTGHVFTHWKTGAVVTPTQAMMGDMLLLWMRRNANRTDVVEWVKERVA